MMDIVGVRMARRFRGAILILGASKEHLRKNLQSGVSVPDCSPILPRLRPRVFRRLSFFQDTNASTPVVKSSPIQPSSRPRSSTRLSYFQDSRPQVVPDAQVGPSSSHQARRKQPATNNLYMEPLLCIWIWI